MLRINELIGKEPRSTKISQLDIVENIITDPNDVSNRLNSHFSQIGPPLSSTIQETLSKFTDYLMPSDKSFTLTEASCHEIRNLIQKMPVNKATGLDNISAYLRKEAAPIIESSLTHVINLSLCSGIFSNNWKIDRFTPIFKEGLKSYPNKYRPISVLLIVSKLIEIVFNQLYQHLNNNNLLTEFQSGFRPMFSTETALQVMNGFGISTITLSKG